jgi:hypothetical protein
MKWIFITVVIIKYFIDITTISSDLGYVYLTTVIMMPIDFMIISNIVFFLVIISTISITFISVIVTFVDLKTWHSM